MLTCINVHIFKLGMPPSHSLIFFVWTPWNQEAIKKPSSVFTRDWKPTGRIFDETCWVRICICKKSTKIGKVMMRKVVTSRKSKTH